jgi:transposase
MRAGHRFVFVSTDKKKAKILYWRDTGVALLQMRLERDLFKVGSPRYSVTRRTSVVRPSLEVIPRPG